MELQREALRAGVRTAQEEVHRVTLELRERAARVERLQNKYDILAARMKAGDGEQHSQAYYIIKAAQEREELQRTGDELDAAIVKADKEARRRCRVRLLSHWGGESAPYSRCRCHTGNSPLRARRLACRATPRACSPSCARRGGARGSDCEAHSQRGLSQPWLSSHSPSAPALPRRAALRRCARWRRRS